MAFDPITAITDSLTAAANLAKSIVDQFADPEKRRLRELEKLTKQIDSKEAELKELKDQITKRQENSK